MDDYFKPWRRKIGVVTLLMACVIAAGWVRSLEFADFFWVDDLTGRGEIFLESINGRIHWYCQNRDHTHFANFSPPCRYLGVMSERSEEPDVFDYAAQELALFRWGDRWVKIGGGQYLSTGPVHPDFLTSGGLCFSIPHWSIIIPLTFLSVWLLLSKPRSKKTSAQIIPDLHV